MNMKLNLKSLFTLTFLIFVSQVCFSLDILSKFHQSDYYVRNLRVEVFYVNTEYFHYFHAIGYKYNRTTTAMNCTFSPKFNMEDETELVVQQYKRASNEYRLFPLRFQINLCRAIATNVVGLKNIDKYGNFTLCFWKKDTTYYTRGFIIDESHLPPLIPSGEYKDNVDLIQQNKKLATLNFYSEIYRPEVKNFK